MKQKLPTSGSGCKTSGQAVRTKARRTERAASPIPVSCPHAICNQTGLGKRGPKTASGAETLVADLATHARSVFAASGNDGACRISRQIDGGKRPLRMRTPVVQCDHDAAAINVVDISTPTSSPHSLTSLALAKSERLLAEFAALGLDDDAQDVSSKPEGEACALVSSIATSACSTPTSQSISLADTVEVPMGVVDHGVLMELSKEVLMELPIEVLMEAWANHGQRTQAPKKIQCSSPLVSPDSQVSEPEPENCSTTGTLSNCCSTQGFSSSSEFSACNSPRMPGASPSRVASNASSVAPTAHKSGLTPDALHAGHLAVQRVQASLMGSKSSSLPSLSLQPRVMVQNGFLGSLRCGITRAPGTCTVQQTITITNTVVFH